MTELAPRETIEEIAERLAIKAFFLDLHPGELVINESWNWLEADYNRLLQETWARYNRWMEKE